MLGIIKASVINTSTLLLLIFIINWQMCSIQKLYTYATYNRSSTGCSCYNTAAVCCGSHLPYLQFGYCIDDLWQYNLSYWVRIMSIYTKKDRHLGLFVMEVWLIDCSCYRMCAPVNRFIWSLSVHHCAVRQQYSMFAKYNRLNSLYMHSYSLSSI